MQFFIENIHSVNHIQGSSYDLLTECLWEHICPLLRLQFTIFNEMIALECNVLTNAVCQNRGVTSFLTMKGLFTVAQSLYS